jgi:hypothetical protein
LSQMQQKLNLIMTGKLQSRLLSIECSYQSPQSFLSEETMHMLTTLEK